MQNIKTKCFYNIINVELFLDLFINSYNYINQFNYFEILKIYIKG